MTFFSPEFFRTNRRRLAESIGDNAIIVIAGNGRMQRTGDTDYPFRQDSNARYFTGLDEPEIVLLVDTSSNVEYIAIPKKNKIEITFGGEIDASRISIVSGVSNIVSMDDMYKLIKDAPGRPIYMNKPTPRRIGEVYANPFRKLVHDALQRRGVKTLDLRPHAAELRSIKQPQEIQAIEQAVRHTHDALKLAHNQLDTYNEQSLAIHIDAHFARHGLSHAYQPIVASGRHAAVLHYTHNNDTYTANDVVLFDVGAEVEGYAADISRTYVVGHNDRAQEVISTVQHIQQAVIDHIRPGATWKELNEMTHGLMAAALKDLNLPSANVRRYFPHAFGHFLGLDVHDVGDYSKPLEAGMVLTVEPGIYTAEESFGVRIEDDVLVTPIGARVLGK